MLSSYVQNHLWKLIDLSVVVQEFCYLCNFRQIIDNNAILRKPHLMKKKCHTSGYHVLSNCFCTRFPTRNELHLNNVKQPLSPIYKKMKKINPNPYKYKEILHVLWVFIYLFIFSTMQCRYSYTNHVQRDGFLLSIFRNQR